MHIKVLLSRSQYVVWFYDNEKRSITKIIPIKFINTISVSLGRSKLFSLSSIFNIIKVVNFDLVLVIILKFDSLLNYILVLVLVHQNSNNLHYATRNKCI